jgi:uncharacterized protein YidB (DUF937 family)
MTVFLSRENHVTPVGPLSDRDVNTLPPISPANQGRAISVRLCRYDVVDKFPTALSQSDIVKEEGKGMGLLDGVLGNVLGSVLGDNQGQGQGQDPLGSLLGQLAGGNKAHSGNMLLQLALSMLQQNGGLEGLLGKFREGGLSRQADSWVGTGQNMNISAD